MLVIWSDVIEHCDPLLDFIHCSKAVPIYRWWPHY